MTLHPAVLLTIICGVLMCLSAGAQTCTPPPPGLIAWWPGDGNANDIQGSHHGTINGNVGFPAGKVDQAFNFNPPDGLDYVRVADSATLEPSSISVAAWVRSPASPGAFRYVVVKGAITCGHASYALYTGPFGGLRFYIGGTDGSARFSHDANFATLWNGQWHHVVGTYDGTTIRLYVDGVEVGGGGAPGNIPIRYSMPSSDDLIIGEWPGTCTLPFQGDVDEVQIFNHVLTPAEITALHVAGSAGVCKVQTVSIDIKPGSSPNSINCGSAGVIPVAILSSADFDATTVDPLTVELNGARVKLVGNKTLKPLCSPEDVNADGLNDLVCHVYTEQFVIEPGEDFATLMATTVGGQKIEGRDHVAIVGDSSCTSQ